MLASAIVYINFLFKDSWVEIPIDSQYAMSSYIGYICRRVTKISCNMIGGDHDRNISPSNAKTG